METLPIIDLKTFTSESDLAAELMRVGKDPGFFYVIGHGIGDEAISPIFKLAENFFNTPLMQKSLFHDGSGDLVGQLFNSYILQSLSRMFRVIRACKRRRA